MIRAVVGLFIFAVALCAYIVMKPSAPTARLAPETAVDVALAAQESLLPGTGPELDADADLPDDPGALVEAALVTGDISISETTTNVLAGLGLVQTVSTGNDPLAAETQTVAASIAAARNAPAPKFVSPPQQPAASALESLVIAALKEGRADQEINQLVNDAARAGTVTVPSMLVTADGTVDTAVLLQTIVAQASGIAPAAVQATTGPAGVSPQQRPARVDAASVEAAIKSATSEPVEYVVSEGDSLGGIAVRFYGNADRYKLIFEANRRILSSPDKIRAGQKLKIPQLPQT